MSSPLLRKLNERKAYLTSLGEQIAALRVELEGLERAHELATVEVRAYEDAVTLSGIEQKPRRQAAGGKRGLSPMWKDILRTMASHHPRFTTNDDIIRIADEKGYELKRDNLRSQMGQYVSKELVERGADGEYRVTEDGAREVGVILKDEPAAPIAADQEGEAVEERSGNRFQPNPTPSTDHSSRLPWDDNDEIPF